MNPGNRPGIFNDVIGPVMRGPSSSHTAASWRIGRLCLDILNEPLKKAIVEFDKDGAWAHNYREQGTEMGINGGLLGMDITDIRMKDTGHLIEERALSIEYKISSFQTQHVNTVRISMEGIRGNNVRIMAASLGGGLFKIYQIDDFELDIRGDYFEILILYKSINLKSESTTSTKSTTVKGSITGGGSLTGKEPTSGKESFIDADEIKKIFTPYAKVHQSSLLNSKLINIKFSKEIPVVKIQNLNQLPGIEKVRVTYPILPIMSGNESKIPFTTIASLLEYAESENYSLGDIGLIYERCLSGLSETALSDRMKGIVGIIDNSIQTGLKGTKHKDRILHHQSHLITEAEKNQKILQNSIVNRVIAYVTAIMEAKSAMEVIVANPTAGSCGTVGGVLKALAEDLNSSEEELISAYFAAGIVGAYFASGPGFSAEEHGCQVECGAASGMAAAAVVQMFGGTARQALDAASMAIQNMIGLVCDPVADRVEVPCLGKNVNAAVNAFASATMACSGFDAVIPLDEVIQTIAQVSQQMPACHKCNGKGGLASTKTALDLKFKLGKK